MKGKSKILLTLFLITWSIFSVISFIQHSNRYIGQSYFDSYEFLETIDIFKDGLNLYVLNDFNAEEAKKQVSVTKEEINNYRYHYGSLTEQIASIQDQYKEKIDEAENEQNNNLKELLEKERDTKIDDITKNFNSDQYVAEKIKKIKYAIIDQYASNYKNEKENFINSYKYISYNLKNVKTGETFKHGSLETSIYKENYGEKSGYYINEKIITIYPSEFTNIKIMGEHSNTGLFNENEEFHLIDELQFGIGEEQFEGTISIAKSMLNSAGFKDQYNNFNVAKIIFYIVWISGILSIILLFTYVKPSKQLFTQSNEIKRLFKKFPFDVKLIIITIISMITLVIIDTIGISFYSYDRLLEPLISNIIQFLILFLFITTLTFTLFWTWETVNSEEKIIKEIKSSIVYQLGRGVLDLFLYRSIAVFVIVCLITAILFGIGVGIAFSYSPYSSFVVIFFSCFGIPVVLLFLQQMGYLNRIMKHTQLMAEGRLNSEIKVKGKFPLAKHAENLNKVREGVKKSLIEQAKSERLKTELITNVSHDLRTPLTSIITYTDLLKNENITEEERKHYVDVIDKKSARLKTLIEDLFEVSKMASGNIELHKERLDLCQLLQQAIGEHKESFEKENLILRTSIPDYPIFAYVDGQKWWRVLDNLIVNALKYSLPGTRVYVSLAKQGNDAIFTIKNVSNYELTENAEELVERFKRADSSRNTEGSGLGLAIVQSIIDLHDSKMNIEVDGDLFKVTVKIKATH